MPKKANDYKVKDADFIEAVKNNTSIRATIMSLGLKETGSAYRVFRCRIAKLGLDTTHFLGQGHLKGKNHTWAKKIPLSKILVKNSSYNNTVNLKNRLIKSERLKNKCVECGLESVWNNKPIVLQLDHINGIHDDNRLVNLRILCPNCHSQTGTFAGKNIGGLEGS